MNRRYRDGRLAGVLVLLFVAACAGPSPSATSAPAHPIPPPLTHLGVADAAAFEADRRAILAMAGEYQVLFQFDELVPLKAGYTPHPPHRSAAHEVIEVIEDSGTRIVLQHLLQVGDQVIKHWRQDWEYQRTRLWAYVGDDTWARRELSLQQAAGTWAQAVWQVDDSPRYAGIGRWDHTGGASSWTSESEWRPLPRRELTTRNDYDKLVGINRQTITPAGWVHEQDNLKIARVEGREEALTRERGLNRYTRVQGHDFGDARRYWRDTRDYWAQVRAAWDARFARHPQLRIRARVEDERLYQSLLSLADAWARQTLRASDARHQIDRVIDRFAAPVLASADAADADADAATAAPEQRLVRAAPY